MASLGTLAVNIVARTSKFTAGITKSLGVTNKFVRGMGTATLALGAFAAGTVAAGATVVRTYENINSALNKSLAIMSDVSDAQRQEMLKTSLAVAKSTQKTTAQAAESYYFLASAGMDAATSIKAMPVVAKFAQAGNFDMALATDLATDAQSALGLTSKDTAESIKGLTRVTNVLIKANTLANASAQQFSEAITAGAGSAMKTSNMVMEEGVAVLAAFADQGIKGAEAGTAFGIVLRDLQTKAIQNKEAFRLAGVGVFDASGEMRNMADIVGDLEGLLGPLSVELRKATLLSMGFSDKSVKYLQTLVGTSGKIKDYQAGLEGSNAASEVAAKSMTDLEKATAQLGAAWDSLALSIGAAGDKLGVFKGAAEFLEGVGIIVDKVAAQAETANGGTKSSNYRENLNTSQDKWWHLTTASQRRGIFDAVHNFAASEGMGPAKSQEEINKWVAQYNASQTPEGKAAAQQKATSDAFAKLYENFVAKPLAKASSEARARAVLAGGQASGWLGKFGEMKGAANDAIMSDALNRLTFGAFGKKLPVASGVAAEGLAGPRQELTARTAGSIDTYAAARRNLGDKPVQTQIAIAKKQLEEAKKTRTAIANNKPTIITIGGVV